MIFVGNVLATIAIFCVIWSISLFILILKSQIVDTKSSKNIVLIVIIGTLMLFTSAYLLNVGEDLNEIIMERKSMNYEMNEEEADDYKANENRYVKSGFQAIAIIALLFLSGLQIIWITQAKIIQKSLKHRPKWDLKNLSQGINGIESNL